MTFLWPNNVRVEDVLGYSRYDILIIMMLFCHLWPVPRHLCVQNWQPIVQLVAFSVRQCSAPHLVKDN